MITAALTMICNTFVEASYYVNGSAPHHYLYSKKAISEAYAFIQGTGLEISLQKYGLDYNANELRIVFHNLFHATT